MQPVECITCTLDKYALGKNTYIQMYRYMYIRGPYFHICVRVFLRYNWQTAVPTPKLPVCLSKRPPHAKKHPLLGQRFHPKAYMDLQRREQNHDTA